MVFFLNFELGYKGNICYFKIISIFKLSVGNWFLMMFNIKIIRILRVNYKKICIWIINYLNNKY